MQRSHDIELPEGQFHTEYVKYGTQTKLMHIYIKPSTQDTITDPSSLTQLHTHAQSQQTHLL